MGLPFSIDDYDFHSAGVCRVGRRMWEQGFCAGSDGNISVRLGEELILITPSGVSKGELRADGMCVLQIGDGSVVHGSSPSSERAVHLAQYQSRAELEAVIHSHAPYATAWACSGLAIPEGIHPEVELFLGRIAVVPYATPGTGELASAAAVAMGGGANLTAALLGNHGTLTVGDGLEQALQRLEMLEGYCRMLTHLRTIGATRRLSDQEMTSLMDVKKRVWGLADDRYPVDEVP